MEAILIAASTNGLYSTVLPGSKPHEAVTITFALLVINSASKFI